MTRAFLVAFFLWPFILDASPCWKTVFEWNEKNISKTKKLLILPFENATGLEEDEWLTHLFPVMLQDDLELSKETTPFIVLSAPKTAFFDPAEAIETVKKTGGHFLVIGQFSRQGSLLSISTRFLDIQKGTEVGRFNGIIEFPGTRTLNLFLTELTLQISKTFKLKGLTRKKLHSFRHETLSPETLRFFVLGTIALKQGSRRGVEEAVRRFKESIRNDFNFVPAYLGLALSFARLGFVENTLGQPYRGSFESARKELEKARLMKPQMTKRKSRETEIYLEAETHYQLGEKYADEGKIKKAIREMLHVVELLNGDLASRERLVTYWTHQGNPRRAEKERDVLNRLSHCEEGE